MREVEELKGTVMTQPERIGAAGREDRSFKLLCDSGPGTECASVGVGKTEAMPQKDQRVILYLQEATGFIQGPGGAVEGPPGSPVLFWGWTLVEDGK